MFIDKFFKKEVKTVSKDNKETETLAGKETSVQVDKAKSNLPLPNDNVQEVKPPNTNTVDTTDTKEEIMPLTEKEMRALHVAGYEEKIAKNPKFKKVYLIKNRKTHQMAEIRAASSYHACTIIGWRPNNVVVLGEVLADQPETQSSSSDINDSK